MIKKYMEKTENQKLSQREPQYHAVSSDISNNKPLCHLCDDTAGDCQMSKVKIFWQIIKIKLK